MLKIDPTRRLAIHTIEGSVSLTSIQNAMAQLFAEPKFDTDFGVVWDLRQSELAITLKEIIYLDRRIVEFANAQRPHGKVAWVPATQIGASIIMMLYGEHEWAQEWQTFHRLDLAIEWAADER